MSLEHSPARQQKKAVRSKGKSKGNRTPLPPAPPISSYTLLTRPELAARLRTTAITVTRSYKRWGLRPVRIAGHILFRSDEVLALEAKQQGGEA